MDSKKKYLKYKKKYFKLLKGGNLTYNYDTYFGCVSDAIPTKIIQLTNENIVVCYYREGYCNIFNINGELIKKFGNNSNFMFPTDLIQLSNNNIAICDRMNNNIQIFDVEGNYVSIITQLINPTHLIQLNNTNIVVPDKITIKIFDINGVFIKNVYHHFEFEDMDVPHWNIINLFNGNFAVYEPTEIQIFNINGEYINTIYLDNFCISMISLNNNNLAMVTDDDSISIYNLAGEKQYVSGVYFKHCTAIIQLQNNNIIAYDDVYRRLYEFDINGSFIKTSTPFHDMIQVSSMIELTNNKIALCDCTNNCVRQFSLGEEIITTKMVTTEINFYYDIERNNKTTEVNIGFYDNGKEILFNYKIMNNFMNIFDTLFINKEFILEPNKVLNFNFINVLNLQNIKGYASTVFHELSKYLSLIENPYFEKDINTNLYKLKIITDINTLDKLFFLGQLFGLAIKFQLIISINLDPILLYHLSHDFTENLIKTISNIVLNNDNYDTIKYFVNGFRSQIDVKQILLDKLSLKLLDKLIVGTTELNLQLFYDQMYLYGFDEENTYILKKIIEDNILIFGEKEYLESLLLILTGTNRIPCDGYARKNSIIFEIMEIDGAFKIEENALLIRPDLFLEYKEKQEESELFKILNYNYLKSFARLQYI